MIGWMLPCSNVLPAEFTQEISEYEILCKLIKEVEELNKKIQLFRDEAKGYTDSQVKLLNQTIHILESNIMNEIDKVNNDLVDLIGLRINELEQDMLERDDRIYHYVDNKFVGIIEQVQALNDILKAQLYTEMVNLKSYVDEGNLFITHWIGEELNEMWQWLEVHAKTLVVISPITNRLESIQKVIDDMWSLINRGALTCAEYDSLGLTCAEYDEKHLSCYQYDTQGRKYLCKDRRFILFNPETGYEVNYKKVIYWLSSLHRENCLTCGEYDNLKKTCGEYDALDISCYNYDWNSANMIA